MPGTQLFLQPQYQLMLRVNFRKTFAHIAYLFNADSRLPSLHERSRKHQETSRIVFRFFLCFFHQLSRLKKNLILWLLQRAWNFKIIYRRMVISPYLWWLCSLLQVVDPNQETVYKSQVEPAMKKFEDHAYPKTLIRSETYKIHDGYLDIVDTISRRKRDPTIKSIFRKFAAQ